ncbi:MFS transporter [Nocardia salmonicida]|uniref:MFS transporter n=1 Tax=Nocardia salmonicida TaxID=53431 RepID=UPI0036593115
MSSPATTEATERGWAPTASTVATICAVGILVVGQLYVVLPVLGDMAAEWGTSRAAATWTTTAFGLAYGAGFLITGPLSDRWGRRPVIVGGLAATALSTLVVIAAPSLGAGLATRVVQGLTASFFAPAAFAYLAERIAPERRVFALTCLTSSFLGAGVIAQVFAQLVDDAFGWQAVFVVGAAQESGEVAPERDPVMTAAGLLAMVNGLGSSVLGGQRTGHAALAVLTHHLDELFGEPR